MKEPIYFYRAHLQSGISLFFQVPGSLSETCPWKQTELQVGRVKCRAGDEERLLRPERVQLPRVKEDHPTDEGCVWHD